MFAILGIARFAGVGADALLFARGHVLEGAVALPALILLAVVWHRTWPGEP